MDMVYRSKAISLMMAALMLLVTIPAMAEEADMDDSVAYIEQTLNLSNNAEQAWTYSASADAWTLTPVSAVAYPELPDQQGVSVCVPGAYVTGIDTDGDGAADVTAADGEAVNGALVIDETAEITSTNGQVYTAATAPVIITTGAAGYGSQQNAAASSAYAIDGYISVACGNRGKQDKVTDDAGDLLYYTGDAPSCLVDQKAATRYVKYNISLGNLPGNVDYFVSTGGSGGGAHAAMLAATSNNPDFYDYQIEAGAAGIYKNEDGSYASTISDGLWGTVAYSAITSLYEADAAQAFEYYMDTAYEFNTPFQAQLAQYLSGAYMAYINAQELTVEEAAVGFDLDGDGALNSTIALRIEYDLEAHPETNGYYGTYLDLYLAEFTQNLQWYLDNLEYAQGWTWFGEDGVALSDDAVAAMTAEDKAAAFIAGRYAKASGGGMMGGMGGMPMGGAPGDMPEGMPEGMPDDVTAMFGEGIRDGGPGMGSLSAAGGSADSANYATFAEMAAAYAGDVQAIEGGDKYGNNIVSLYNPLHYIGAEGTENPTWAKVVMGAVEGDISMLNSLNLQIAWLNAGVDAVIEWQWDGGHVPSETLGNSLALYVDQMVGEHINGMQVDKAEAAPVVTNGDAEEATGKDLSGWVNAEDLTDVSFSLTDVLAYRNSGASKAVPGFDVIDHGQENYVFGNAEADARHWDAFVSDIFQDAGYAEVLAPLFTGASEE